MSHQSTKITKKFEFSFRSIWLAKLRHFMRRSLWRYLLAALLLTFGRAVFGNYRLMSLETLRLWVCLTAGCVILGFGVILISVMSQTKRFRNRNVQITFSENEVLIVQSEVGKEIRKEIYSWDQIEKVEDTLRYIMLAFKKCPWFYLVIQKQRLTKAEIDLLIQWLRL